MTSSTVAPVVERRGARDSPPRRDVRRPVRSRRNGPDGVWIFTGVINLPSWSSLMSKFHGLRPTLRHDQASCATPLTSIDAPSKAQLITRLTASGLGFDSLAAHQFPQVTALPASGGGSQP